MTDNEIESLLRNELTTEVQGVQLPGHVLTNAARRHGRRRTITGIVGAAGGATALAVCAVAVLGSGIASGDRHPSQAASAPHVETVADIQPKIDRALDSTHAIMRTAGTEKMYNHAKDANGKEYGGYTAASESWFDPDSGYYTSRERDDGVLTYAMRYPPRRNGTELDINYPYRTYTVRPWKAVPSEPQLTGKGGVPLFDTVAQIKVAIKQPSTKIVGHEKINGRDATHLRYAFPVGKTGDAITGDAWFDSSTYSPLRWTQKFGAGFTTTTFLPRTPANLAKTNLTVPDGFRKVPVPNK